MEPSTFTYPEIQQALERCMAAEPPHGVECRLSRDASLLGDILGEMIYRKLDSVLASAITGKHFETLERWIVTTDSERISACSPHGSPA